MSANSFVEVLNLSSGRQCHSVMMVLMVSEVHIAIYWNESIGVIMLFMQSVQFDPS